MDCLFHLSGQRQEAEMESTGRHLKEFDEGIGSFERVVRKELI